MPRKTDIEALIPVVAVSVLARRHNIPLQTTDLARVLVQKRKNQLMRRAATWAQAGPSYTELLQSRAFTTAEIAEIAQLAERLHSILEEWAWGPAQRLVRGRVIRTQRSQSAKPRASSRRGRNRR